MLIKLILGLSLHKRFSHWKGCCFITALLLVNVSALVGHNGLGVPANSGAVLDLHELAIVDSFYQVQENRIFWLDGASKRPNALAEGMLQCIAESSRHGLLPEDYHYERLSMTANRARASVGESLPMEELQNFELLMTDAFVHLALHYYQGKVQPDSLMNWFIKPKPKLDWVSFLTVALQEDGPCAALERLLPIHAGYWTLVAQLERYRNLNWRPIDADVTVLVQRGDDDPLVLALRERLLVTGDLPEGDLSSTFDRPLENAILNFQYRQGITQDGMLRGATLDKLNIPVEDRIKQIIVNLERWRWLPDDLGDPHIAVNIPAFELQGMVDGQMAYRERVIVGQRRHPTPAFSDSMRYLVFNPFWNVPKSIIKNELIPRIIEDEEYCEEQGIEVFRGKKKVDTKKVDWKNAKAEDYWFRQLANEKNPMGRVKFMFPNRHSVYIHDTPDRDLFVNSHRSYSHGCVRIQEPYSFADYILSINEGWRRSKVDELLELPKQSKIDIAEPLAVHIFYFTAFEDQHGAMNFREDVYLHDDLLYAQLTGDTDKVKTEKAKTIQGQGVNPILQGRTEDIGEELEIDVDMPVLSPLPAPAPASATGSEIDKEKEERLPALNGLGVD